MRRRESWPRNSWLPRGCLCRIGLRAGALLVVSRGLRTRSGIIWVDCTTQSGLRSDVEVVVEANSKRSMRTVGLLRTFHKGLDNGL